MNIAVAGCGVIGLSTGLLLLRNGHNVTIYADKTPLSHNLLTSNIAIAFWLPLWIGDEKILTPEYMKRQERWSVDAFHEFEKLVGDTYGVKWHRAHELFPWQEHVPDFLTKLLPNFEATSDDTLPEVPDFPMHERRQRYRWSFDSFVIETPIYLRRLLHDFEEAGGRVVRKAFQTIQDILNLPENFVFNCTGLGSRNLFADASLKGIKGQLLLHEPIDIDFVMGAQYFCLIPRSDALVIGALYQETYDTENPTPENEEILWRNVTQICSQPNRLLNLPSGTLSHDKIIGSVAGLRPYRPAGIRIDHEEIQGKHIIHDYGHGGGGISLSWGCALEAVALFTSSFE